MNNHPTQEHLIDYIHGELLPADDAFVLAHLERCGVCKAEYEAQLRIDEALHAYGRMTERELPGMVRAAVWRAIDDGARESAAGRLGAWLRPVLGFGFAAGAAAAIVFGVIPSLHRAGPAAIDAMYFLDDHAAMRASVPFNESGSGQQWLASSGSSDVAVDAFAQ